MPSQRPICKICLGDRLEVEVVQPNGGRALVVGTLAKRWFQKSVSPDRLG